MAKAADKPGKLAGIDSKDIEDLYPMSDIEKGMVYHSIKEPEQSLYHDQMVHQVTYPDFDPGRFKKTMMLMVEKHPILRTTLHLGDFEDEIQIGKLRKPKKTDQMRSLRRSDSGLVEVESDALSAALFFGGC
jgi:hypothetical protein